MAHWYEMRIDKGSTFRRTFYYRQPDGKTPIDLTGYTARLVVRPSYSSEEILLDLTSAVGGGLTVVPATGEVRLEQTDEQTAAYTWLSGVYDLEITSPGGEVTRLVEGRVIASPEATR